MPKKIIEELAKECPCVKGEGEWCFFRELILYITDHMDSMDRQTLQIRAIYDYKYRASKKEGCDIGLQNATENFIRDYGRKFSELYKEKEEKSFTKPKEFLDELFSDFK